MNLSDNAVLALMAAQIRGGIMQTEASAARTAITLGQIFGIQASAATLDAVEDLERHEEIERENEAIVDDMIRGRRLSIHEIGAHL